LKIAIRYGTVSPWYVQRGGSGGGAGKNKDWETSR
jgi:hypothetical protein